MLAAVKPSRRGYHSPQRKQQAQATRRQIIDGASRLFCRDGYFGTTIEAIALEAGVAVPTVYAGFGGKRAILSALIDTAIFGADPPGTAVSERSWYRTIASEPDAARLLRGWAEYLCAVNARVAPVQRVVQSAAASDAEIAELWQGMKHQRLKGQSAVVRLLAERGALRPGISVEHPADVLFVLSDAYVHDLYMDDRGWTSAELAQWLGDAFCSQLL